MVNSEKIRRFSRDALRPTLVAFLRDIGGKIAGIPQCRALGTTLGIAKKLAKCISLSAYLTTQWVNKSKSTFRKQPSVDPIT